MFSSTGGVTDPQQDPLATTSPQDPPITTKQDVSTGQGDVPVEDTGIDSSTGDTIETPETGDGDIDLDTESTKPLVDSQGRAVNALGQLVDDQGRAINEAGQLIDEEGRRINDDGDLIDDQGRIIDEEGFLIDDQDRRINEEGFLIDDQGRRIDEEGYLLDDTGAKIGSDIVAGDVEEVDILEDLVADDDLPDSVQDLTPEEEQALYAEIESYIEQMLEALRLYQESTQAEQASSIRVKAEQTETTKGMHIASTKILDTQIAKTNEELQKLYDQISERWKNPVWYWIKKGFKKVGEFLGKLFKAMGLGFNALMKAIFGEKIADQIDKKINEIATFVMKKIMEGVIAIVADVLKKLGASPETMASVLSAVSVITSIMVTFSPVGMATTALSSFSTEGGGMMDLLSPSRALEMGGEAIEGILKDEFGQEFADKFKAGYAIMSVCVDIAVSIVISVATAGMGAGLAAGKVAGTAAKAAKTASNVSKATSKLSKVAKAAGKVALFAGKLAAGPFTKVAKAMFKVFKKLVKAFKKAGKALKNMNKAKLKKLMKNILNNLKNLATRQGLKNMAGKIGGYVAGKAGSAAKMAFDIINYLQAYASIINGVAAIEGAEFTMQMADIKAGKAEITKTGNLLKGGIEDMERSMKREDSSLSGIQQHLENLGEAINGFLRLETIASKKLGDV